MAPTDDDFRPAARDAVRVGRGRVLLVAIGGNALVSGDDPTVDGELTRARVIARDLARLVVEGYRVVVTHGNGPQVGIILKRSDLTSALDPSLPPLPLAYCVAETQGGIGHLLVAALRDDLRRQGLPDKVAGLLMHAVVDPADPAFTKPSKPIGPFYSRSDAESVRRHRGWELVEDSGRGYRRVVPSPVPRRLLGMRAVRALVGAGYMVVTAGGGGIPVVDRPDGTYEPIDAVIDKDRASALLAAEVGASTLVLSTAVEQVSLDFGRPTQHAVARLTLDEARRHLHDGQFPPGSMGPKVEAAISFVEARPDGEAIITSLDRVHDALEGRTGTRIVRAATAAAAEGRART